MMKLKHLFDNRDLAIMLLENWLYDKDKTDIMNRFRISSNAVYPFMNEGKVWFLRFSPIEEKSEKDLLAELDFIGYLSINNYNSVKVILTENQRKFVKTNTPWGEYLAVAFECVLGDQMGKLEYSAELYFSYGKSLGQLHKLSKNYKPKNNLRYDWKHRLNLTKSTLLEYSAQQNAIVEVDILLNFFDDLALTNDNFGLIHYDFELDNVFYDDITKQHHIIDFDDCVYHWFAMDIEQSLDSIKSELSTELHKEAVDSFLSGYHTETELCEDMQKMLPIFRRYANIFSYARCLRSLNETWENEPEWMINLRIYISKLMHEYELGFGKKIK